ncbi:hypothetical protein LK489_19620, partial [Phocaeicola vulgatus]|nr:hypothetical protein [Phocaeicola vulgatus]
WPCGSRRVGVLLMWRRIKGPWFGRPSPVPQTHPMVLEHPARDPACHCEASDCLIHCSRSTVVRRGDRQHIVIGP